MCLVLYLSTTDILFLRADATAVPMGTFGPGTGPTYIDNTACTGTEPRLLACNYDRDTSDCTHAEDAGLRCNIGPRKITQLDQ